MIDKNNLNIFHPDIFYWKFRMNLQSKPRIVCLLFTN